MAIEPRIRIKSPKKRYYLQGIRKFFDLRNYNALNTAITNEEIKTKLWSLIIINNIWKILAIFLIIFIILCFIAFFIFLFAKSSNPNQKEYLEKVDAFKRTITNNQIIYNYNIFANQKFSDFKVVTGWQFADSKSDIPDAQWCYIEKGNTIYRIARIGKDGIIENTNNSHLYGDNNNWSEYIESEARKYCTWYQK